MTCACCESGRCCSSGACNATSRSECASNSGTFTAGGDCTAYACTFFNQPCTLLNACACAAIARTLRFPITTCNCTALIEAGVAGGGCRVTFCEECVEGNCVNTCPSPRTCCAGTCCPLPQTCVNSACVDKCGAGTTFCAGNGAAFNCCGANTKCCGASGCLPTQSSTNFSVDVTSDSWLNTGVTIPAGATVTINATGTAQWRLPVLDNIGPNGTAAYPSDGYCNPLSGVLHMRLIGRVGGVMFSVGDSYTGQPGAGALELRQNDSCVGDNEGFYTGTISLPTDPCPGFTPAAIGEPIVYGEGEEPPKLSPGPGAALKDILKLGGIVASPTCSCNARAAQMDEWGSGQCIRRCREIVGWLKEESEKRDLWFFSPAGYALVFAAVALAALKRFWKSNNQ